jgi:3-hydroxybutyryl-CoA dehydratase
VSERKTTPRGRIADKTTPRRRIADESMRWSDPFDALAVGKRFHSGARTVRDTDVIVFSALTGDWHPQHCDPEWAASSPFGERIAHGLLVLSLAVGLVPLDPERVLALRRVADVVFKRPVRFEDAISVAGELTGLRPVDERTGLVDFDWRIRNQDDALVVRASVQLVWRRDGAGEDAGDGAGRARADRAGGARAGGARAAGSWHDPVADAASTGEFVPLPL